MSIESMRGRARGDFAFQSAGSINAARANARPLAGAGDRYANFRAQQLSGIGIPSPSKK